MFKTNATRQRRIRRLADAMKDTDVGDQLTHAQIARIAGINPCPPDIFNASHRLANRETGVYFDSVRGVGYIRREAADWDGVGYKFLKRARGRASAGRKFVTNMTKNTNELSDEEQRRASRQIGLMQTIEALTRRIAESP